jgi:hypothetical protein
MLITEMLGRLNLGVISEQAPSAKSSANPAKRTGRNKVRVSRGNMRGMIPIFARCALGAGALLAPWALLAALADVPPAPDPVAAPAAGPPISDKPVACLVSGDGYLHATLGGAVNSKLDWPNSGTLCQGESRDKPPGVRLSFQRPSSADPNLLLVFGLTGVTAGESAHAVKTNLTVIVQGTTRIFGTLGDSRCTVDSLTQTPLEKAGSFRLEARGFCTQPAHAVRGKGDVLVSTFEFAGPVTFDEPQKN